MYYSEDYKTLKEKMAEKEELVLSAIKKLMKQGAAPPSIREIRQACGFKSTSTALDYLKRLQQKGLVDWQPKKIRTLQLIEQKKNSAE